MFQVAEAEGLFFSDSNEHHPAPLSVILAPLQMSRPILVYLLTAEYCAELIVAPRCHVTTSGNFVARICPVMHDDYNC